MPEEFVVRELLKFGETERKETEDFFIEKIGLGRDQKFPSDLHLVSVVRDYVVAAGLVDVATKKLLYLWVDEGYRRMGLGKRLTEFFLCKYESLRLEIAGDPRAYSFYFNSFDLRAMENGEFSISTMR